MSENPPPRKPSAELPGTDRAMAPVVNSLGVTPPIELPVLSNEVGTRLAAHTVTAARSLVTDRVTGPDTTGASIAVRRLDERPPARRDAPVGTPAPHWGA